MGKPTHESLTASTESQAQVFSCIAAQHMPNITTKDNSTLMYNDHIIETFNAVSQLSINFRYTSSSSQWLHFTHFYLTFLNLQCIKLNICLETTLDVSIMYAYNLGWSYVSTINIWHILSCSSAIQLCFIFRTYCKSQWFVCYFPLATTIYFVCQGGSALLRGSEFVLSLIISLD